MVRYLTNVQSLLQRRAFTTAAVGLVIGGALPLRRANADLSWPSRTVRIITLGAPGAGTDAVARTLGDALSRRWKQPVVVENRPGGDGIVAIQTFLAARDGHTLLFNPNGTWTALHLMHEQLAFDPVRDLIPLCSVVHDFLALAVSPKLGVSTMAEVVDAARARPGSLNWTCAPSVPYLAFTAFMKEHGLDLVYVAYKNPILAIPDLAEGRIDLAFLPVMPMIGPAEAGKLRLIAIASDDRAPLAPSIPTVREAGFPTLSIAGGHSLFGPKEMLEALRTRIAADVRLTLMDDDITRRMTSMGYPPRTESTAELAALLERDRRHWTELARLYGAKPPQ
jgi:tripartite-type tricarboxylate transporter receptor subunit TctC